MAASITKETGAGVEGANCYFDMDELDAYFETHPYASAVTELSADQKIRCSIAACRTVDASAEIRGYRVGGEEQDMEWPRLGVRVDVDPAAIADVGAVTVTGGENVLSTGAGAVPSNIVPKRWRQACMEMVRFIAAQDRDTKFDKPAVKREKIDVIEREFTEAGSAIDLLPEIVQRMIKPYVISADDAGQGGAGPANRSARAVQIIRG